MKLTRDRVLSVKCGHSITVSNQDRQTPPVNDGLAGWRESATVPPVATSKFSSLRATPSESLIGTPAMEKYSALHVVAFLLKAAATICAGLGVASAFYLVVNSSDVLGRNGTNPAAIFFGFVGALLGGTVSFLILWAMSELIMVFIDIEENTRTTRFQQERR